MSYHIKTINKSQLYLIQSLWEKLNAIHLENSTYFKSHYEKYTFEERCEKFTALSDDNIFIEILIQQDNDNLIGYCISTIEEKIGEIDSLFIEEEHRKYSYGKKLVENGIKWLKEQNCSKILVAVAEGNESVFGFYKKSGFFPRMTYLQLKD